MLVAGRAGTRITRLVELSVLMDKTQRNELSESTGFFLYIAQKQQVINPVFFGFGVSVHHCRGSSYTEPMRGFDYLNPLACLKFYALDLMTNAVIKDFGGGTGQCIESVFLEHSQVIGKLHSGQLNSINDLHWRKRMGMHFRS